MCKHIWSSCWNIKSCKEEKDFNIWWRASSTRCPWQYSYYHETFCNSFFDWCNREELMNSCFRLPISGWGWALQAAIILAFVWSLFFLLICIFVLLEISPRAFWRLYQKSTLICMWVYSWDWPKCNFLKLYLC